MQTVAAFFPLKWMAQGLRSVFLPDVARGAGAGRLAGSWAGSRWCSALWCVVGLVLCVAHLPLAGPRSGLSYVARVPAPLTAETLARAPKVLLHDHLDGGLRPQTVLELADESGYRDLPAADAGEPRRTGSGRPPTPARWCSTWRRSRTPSA